MKPFQTKITKVEDNRDLDPDDDVYLFMKASPDASGSSICSDPEADLLVYQEAQLEPRRKYYEQWNRIFQFISTYENGIGLHSLGTRFIEKYNIGLKLRKRSDFECLEKNFRGQVEIEESTNRPKSKVICTLYSRLIKSQKSPSNCVRATIGFLAKLRRIINCHRGGLFVNQLITVYGRIYGPDDFSTEIAKYMGGIDFLVTQIKEICVETSRVHGKQKFVQIRPSAATNETDAEIDRYFADFSGNIPTQTRSIVEMVQFMKSEGAAVVPLQEVAIFYQSHHKSPILPRDFNIYSLISSISKLQIDENYMLEGKRLTVVSLKHPAAIDMLIRSGPVSKYDDSGYNLDPDTQTGRSPDVIYSYAKGSV